MGITSELLKEKREKGSAAAASSATSSQTTGGSITRQLLESKGISTQAATQAVPVNSASTASAAQPVTLPSLADAALKGVRETALNRMSRAAAVPAVTSPALVPYENNLYDKIMGSTVLERYSSSLKTQADEVDAQIEQLKQKEQAAEAEDWELPRLLTPDEAAKRRSDYETYQEQIAELTGRRDALAAQYYTVENQAQQAKLQKDTAMLGQYSGAKAIQEDLDKIAAVAADYAAHGGVQSQETAEYVQYLKDAYGLTDQALKNYAIGGSQLRPAGEGYTNLWQLYEDLEARQKSTADSLAAADYDYARMTEYEQRLEDAKAYEQKQAEWQQYAKEHPVLSSIDTVLVSPFQGVDYLKTMASGIGHSDTGDLENYVPLNTYNMDTTNMVSTVRGTVAQGIQDKIDNETLGNVASFLYQTGMSVADSAVQVAAMGEWATLVMGMSAASNQAKDIIERGGTNKQAFWGGLAAGAAEAVFEKVSIDRLLSTKSVTGWKSWLKETAKQAGTEASEEMLTEVANILSDAAIMGDNSNFANAVARYKAQDMTEEQAKRQAYLDCVKQVALAGAGGALSGGIMGGVVNTVNAYGSGVFMPGSGLDTPVTEQTPANPAGRAEAGASGTAPTVGTSAQNAASGSAETTFGEGQNNTASTGETAVNENGLIAFSELEVTNLSTGVRNKIASTFQDVVSFVRNALRNKQSTDRAYLGKIPDTVAQKVLADTGVSVNNYNAVLQSDNVRHIFKQHGDVVTETARGQVPVTAEDVALIPQVLASPDSVRLSEQTDTRGRRILIFEKQIGNRYVTMQAVTDGNHSLQTDTLFIQKEKNPLVTGSDASVSTGPAHNVQNVPPSGSSDLTVPQTAQGVKGQDVQSEVDAVPAATETARPIAQQAYDVKRIQRAASALGENGAKALNTAYDGSVDADVFYGGFAAYYEAGVSGLDMDKVRSEYGAQLNEAQKYAAYVSGQNDAAVSLKREQRATQFAQTAGTDSGLVFDDYVADTLDAGTADRVNSVARALGVRVRFVDSVREGTANASIEGSEILVEKGNPNPVLFLLGHEWTHRMQELAPTEYRAFRDFAAGELQGEARVLLEQYREAGEDVTYEQALDEAAANYAGRMIEDGAVLDDFIEKHRDDRTLLEKVRDAIRAVIAKLTGVERRQAQTAEGKLTAALEAAAKQAGSLQDSRSGDTMGTVRNSLKEDGQDGRDRESWAETAEDFNARMGSEGKKWTERASGGYRIGGRLLDFEGTGEEQPLNAYVPAKETQEKLKELGIESQVYLGAVEINRGGKTRRLTVEEAVTLFRDMVVINGEITTDPAETAGHEAYHMWAESEAAQTFQNVLDDNLDWGSDRVREEFAWLEEHYPENHVLEEMHADYAGKLHAGTNDKTLRPMFRDYDAVKAAWEALADSHVEGAGDHGTGFSLKGSESAGEIAKLRKENRYLREKWEYWKGQTRRTQRVTTDQKAVTRAARDMVKAYGADVDAGKVAGELQELYDFIASGTDGKNELSYEDARERAGRIAQEIVENAVAKDDETYRQYSELREHLRTVSMTISEADSRNIADYGAWRRSYSGRLNLKKGGATNIDQVYQELSQMYPEFFDDGPAHPVDQLLRIADVLDSVSGVTEYNPYSMYEEQAVSGLANEIMDTFFDLPQTKKTFADKQNAKYEKLRAENRQRMDKLRAEKNAKIERIQEHYAQVRKDQAARRADSKARNRLLNLAKRLQNKKLPAANRALLNQYIGDLDTISRSLTGRSVQKLTELSEWYDEQKKDPDFIRDERIEEDIKRLSKRHIDDLTADEVAELTEVLLFAENTLRTNQQLIDAQDRRNVYIQGGAVIENVRNSRPWKSGLISDMLSPERFARRVTGYAENDPLQSAFRDLSRGQRDALDYQRRASQGLEHWTGDRKFMRSLSGEKAQRIEITGTDAEGNAVTANITPAMRISLYLHSRNADNLRHIAEGGVTIPNEKSYRKGNLSDAYTQGKTTLRLSPSNIREITSHMTGRERAFANAIYQYFNTTSKEALNQTWEKLKGYDAFTEEDYFPINADSKFTRADYEGIKQDGTLTNPGYAQERVHAKNPILLRDANAVVEQSIRQHSKLVGLGIPVRNLNKLMNVTQTGYADSVMNAIGDVHGKRAASYLEKLMNDVQEGSRTEPDNLGNWIAKARSKYAGAVLELNASVAIKQTASYPTAAAVLGWKPLAQAADGIAGKNKVDTKLVQTYTPNLWYRSLGFSSQELGDLQAQGKGLPKALNWIQGMDVATTTLLWRASEHYVDSNFPGLEKGSSTQIQSGQSEYYKKVAEIYNRVIEETQPNYTVMQRPQILRSKNELTRTLNMFKTQPFQNFNILYDALNDLSAKRRAYSTSSTEETKQSYRTAQKTAARAITSQLASSFIFALMQFGWDAFRRKDDKYRDDEGDLTIQSWAKGMGLNMATNAFGMLPFGSEVYSLLGSLTDKVLEGMDKDPFFDSTFYGFEASVLETLNDTADDSVTGIISGITAIQQAMDGEQDVDWEALVRDLYDAAVDYAELNGLPAANVQKTFAAIAEQTLVAAQGEYVGGYFADRIANQPGTSKWKSAGYDHLWQALKAGDIDAYDTIAEDMQKYGLDGKTISSKMKSLYEAEVKAGKEPGLTQYARDLIGVVDSYADAQETPDSFGADDLTAAQYKSYNTERAEAYRDIVDTMQGYRSFNSMDAETRDKLLDAADKLTKETALENNSDGEYTVGTKWMNWATGGGSYGVDEAEAILFKVAYDMAVSGKDENGKTIAGSKKENTLETVEEWMPWLTERELAYLESCNWTPSTDALKELKERGFR